FDALDIRADGAQLLLDLLVAAIDVIDAVDARGAARDQASEHHRGAGAKIACHHRCAVKFFHALNDCGGSLFADSPAHAIQFADVQEAVGEDALGDHANSI